MVLFGFRAEVIRQQMEGTGKRQERNERKVFATGPVAYPLRPLRSPRFPLFYPSEGSRLLARERRRFPLG